MVIVGCLAAMMCSMHACWRFWGLQEALASECRGLRVVNLNRCFKVTDKAIHALVATNAQLHDVRLAFTAITDSALTGLAKAGPHLHRVEVAGCKGISNAGLEALAKACRNIVQVDMSGCDKVSTAGVVAIAQNCTALLHVQMAELYLVKDEAVKVSAMYILRVEVALPVAFASCAHLARQAV